MVLRKFAVFMLWSLTADADGEDNAEAMKTMSLSFGRMLYTCQKEMMFGDAIMYDFLHFWQPEYPLTKNDIGCAVICVSKKLKLLDDDGAFLIPNADGFSRASGADDEMVKSLLGLVGGCRNASAAVDGCGIALEVANCFRAGARLRLWVPHVPDDVVEAAAAELNIR